MLSQQASSQVWDWYKYAACPKIYTCTVFETQYNAWVCTCINIIQWADLASWATFSRSSSLSALSESPRFKCSISISDVPTHATVWPCVTPSGTITRLDPHICSLPIACILHFVHEIPVPISWSPKCSWGGLALAKMCPVQWVTLIVGTQCYENQDWAFMTICPNQLREYVHTCTYNSELAFYICSQWQQELFQLHHSHPIERAKTVVKCNTRFSMSTPSSCCMCSLIHCSAIIRFICLKVRLTLHCLQRKPVQDVR